MTTDTFQAFLKSSKKVPQIPKNNGGVTWKNRRSMNVSSISWRNSWENYNAFTMFTFECRALTNYWENFQIRHPRWITQNSPSYNIACSWWRSESVWARKVRGESATVVVKWGYNQGPRTVSCAAALEPRPRDVGPPTSAQRLAAGAPERLRRRLGPRGDLKFKLPEGEKEVSVVPDNLIQQALLKWKNQSSVLKECPCAHTSSPSPV